MRKEIDFGWEEDLGDGIILCLNRISDTNKKLGVIKGFENTNAVEDREILHEWMDSLYWTLDEHIKRLNKELTIEGNPEFIRKKMSSGLTANPIAKYRSSIAWACKVQEI